MLPTRWFGLFLFVTFVGSPSIASGQGPVVLVNKTWRIAFDPATLGATATLPGKGQPLLLSAPETKPFRVERLALSPDQSHWELPDEGLTVAVRLDDDSLSVDFTSVSAGEFTWPILIPRRSVRAYILPIGEGVYAPAHDPSWSAYLAKQDGLSTTENLSLPLWGIDGGKHTLTFLATNPFNNELSFQDWSGNLGARFTHCFTRNWKVKTFGFRISLGPSSPIEPARQYRRRLIQTGQFVGMKQKIARTPDAAKLLGAAHIYLWGDGLTAKMIDALYASGFDRLWLGSPNWSQLLDNPEAIEKAKEFGYLIGPYDSYDSVHSPDAKPDDTWETAQFDEKLFENGGIVLADGRKKSGFEHKGYYLSEAAAEPYMRERVARLEKAFGCNSWFIDCDAAGEFYDDYSPLHPANQQEEMLARLRRMAWIRDTYHLVIGSEGGSAYSAGTIHFAHGMMSEPFGWGDPDLRTKGSPYFLGAFFPADGPDTFFKQVPLKPAYYRFQFDSRFRLPLYQTVFHDSVVTTEHWTLPTLKFTGQIVERALLEMLYNVPPLFHLNSQEFARHGSWIKAQYAFFSPLHRLVGLMPLTSFDWLTEDHQVQRTRFGDRMEIVGNFRSTPFVYKGFRVAPKSVLALDLVHQTTSSYTPRTLN